MAKGDHKIISLLHYWKNSLQRIYRLQTFVSLLRHNLNWHELLALRLLAVEKPADLAALLNTTFAELENHINKPSYREFYLEKKRGGRRIIHEPQTELKLMLRLLNKYLQSYYLCIKPDGVHGFVISPRQNPSGCNIALNAQPHTGRNHLLNMDISDFFPSIGTRRIKELFSSRVFGFNSHIATALALLTTYKGKLPVGAPTSPAISNFVCLEMDAELSAFCDKNKIVYTRYADDMSFSSDLPFTKRITDNLEFIIQRHGFALRNEKTRMSGKNRQQTVTGLVVNEKVNVDRKFIRKVRAMLHDCMQNGLLMAAITHFGIPEQLNEEEMKTKIFLRLSGYIAFIGQIRGREDPLFLKLRHSFTQLSENA